jgi:hypothetical protein
MNKRAELISQPLMYIFIIIVIALILALGIKFVFDLQKTAEQTAHAKFKQDLDSAINQVYTKDTGSSLSYTPNSKSYKGIAVAPKVEIVCFTDKTTLKSSPILTKEQNSDLAQLKSKNVIIFPLTDHTPLEISNIQPAENPFCIRIKGTLTNFKLENKDNQVVISKI